MLSRLRLTRLILPKKKSLCSLVPSGEIQGGKKSTTSNPAELWEDPWSYARGSISMDGTPRAETRTGFDVSKDEFKWVERLLPKPEIPTPLKLNYYPSGWVAPKDPPPDLPYRIRRTRYHTFPLYLECRRDQLNPETFQFDYVELVVLKMVDGDVFACEKDLREYLEARLGRNVATHVNEVQGKIRIKGADRSLLEQFLVEKGF